MGTGAPDQFHYSKDGQPAGPVTKRVLLQLIATGKLRASDLVYDERAKEWRQVFEHPELNEDESSSDPPAIAPAKALPRGGSPAVLPGQFPVYKPFKPKEKFEGRARAAMICGMIGIVVLPLGLFAAYIGADAVAGMNRTGNQAGRKDAMTGLVLGMAELTALMGLSIWLSSRYSFIDWMNK